jgi:cell division protein FtsZ
VVTEHEPLELSAEDEAGDSPAAASPAAVQATPARFGAQDEFLLDARRLADDEPAAVSGLRRRPIAPGAQNSGIQPSSTAVPVSQPAPAPAQPRLGASQEPPARPAAGGGTLFERMANLTGRRKVIEEEEDEGEDGGAINIPRFLGRQNNQ